MDTYDLFVIGGGSGGIRSARLAAEMGKKVGLAEEDRLGGTCVIRGCIPKKLMVYAADFADTFADSAQFGWSYGETSFNLKTFKEAKDCEINRIENIYHQNLTQSGVEIFKSRAHLQNQNTVELDSGQRLSAKTILIATGGQPYIPEFPGRKHVMTSNDMFHLESLPKRVLICGGGYIACEFTGIFNGMGSQVTQYYRGEQILRGFDANVQSHLYHAMCERGIDVQVQTSVKSITPTESGKLIVNNRDEQHEFDIILYATGRRPNTAGIGLEDVGIDLDSNGAIIVNSLSQSSQDSVYAIGDVTNRLNLTPVAIRDGVAFIETVFKGNPTVADHVNVPTAVFSRPEIGTIGMTEQLARESCKIDVYEAHFKPLANTIANRNEFNYIKMITESTNGCILGIHIVGPSAAEMIQLAGVAVRMGATKEDFDRTVAVHPTAAEELVTFKKPVQRPCI